jgi:cobalamin biosynthesis protein CobT
MPEAKTKFLEEEAPGRRIKTDTFQAETVGVTRTLGRAHNLDVVFAGTQAGTNGTTIVIPALPAGGEMSNEQARAVRGFADHEAAHIRHTDMELWRREFSVAEKDVPPALVAFTNAIEDVRIERLAVAEYPGVQSNLAATVALMDKHTRKDFAAMDPKKLAEVLASPALIGSMAITMAGRSATNTAKPICDAFMDMLDPAVKAKVDSWMPKVMACTSTKDALDLAVEITTDLGIYEPPKKGSGSGSGGAGGGTGSGRRGAGAGGMSEDGKGRFTNGGDGAGDRANDGVAAGSFEHFVSPELNRFVAEEAKLMNVGKGGNVYRVQSTANDKLHTRHDTPGMYVRTDGRDMTYGAFYLANPRGIANYEASQTATRSSLNVMRNKLQRMMLATQNRDWEGGLEAGTLDPRRLVAASLGTKTVWRKRTERAELDTSVMVLIDLSGSMSGSKAAMAQQVAVAMAQAFETMGIDYGIWGFCNKSGPCDAKMAGAGKGGDPRLAGPRGTKGVRTGGDPSGGWGRIEALDMFVFKDFDEKLREARGSLGSITNCVGGNNSDGDAIMYAWQALKKRPGKRKVLLTLSDGYPAAAASCGAIEGRDPASWRTADAVKTVGLEGGECVGIGIQSDAVSHFYPKYAVAKSLDDFANATMDVLAKVLLGERTNVGKTNAKFVNAAAKKKAA